MSQDLSSSTTKTVETCDTVPSQCDPNENFRIESDTQQFESVIPSKKAINDIPTYIIWSIINLLFIPFGFICFYFSYKVKHFKTLNYYQVAEKWSKRTFALNMITTLVMFGVIITVCMLHYDYEQRNPDTSVNQTYTTEAYIPWQPGR